MKSDIDIGQRIFDKKEEEYVDYIYKHQGNVKLIFKEIQKYLKDEYWLDEYLFSIIEELINIHDDSKYSLEEFDGYRQWFYPEDNEEQSEKQFEYAWNYHQKTNPHHWEFWIMVDPQGYNGYKVLEMPFVYIFEMLCDWSAMSIKFKDTPSEFFRKNKDNMLLNIRTIKAIKNWIGIFDKCVNEINNA